MSVDVESEPEIRIVYAKELGTLTERALIKIKQGRSLSDGGRLLCVVRVVPSGQSEDCFGDAYSALAMEWRLRPRLRSFPRRLLKGRYPP
jgi:hypothetical protein